MIRPMPDDDQIDLLRSVLAHAYEKRQPFLLRLVQAVKDYVSPRTPRKPIIENLNIIEKNRGEFLRMPIFRRNVELLCGLDRYESPVIGLGKRQEYFLAGSSVTQFRGIFKLAGGSFSALGDLPEEGCNVAPQRTHI